ncbi:hypothetical protein HK100_002702 [Physocladia obscura]|uniref:Uncharacterized protein n=1 Tax=Physocladia obscura TaxID=109957 RepID=A0AAD5SY67_9FUNG|nr:hypothetical protein HK100_002702 [Physocladia obscura]
MKRPNSHKATDLRSDSRSATKYNTQGTVYKQTAPTAKKPKQYSKISKAASIPIQTTAVPARLSTAQQTTKKSTLKKTPINPLFRQQIAEARRTKLIKNLKLQFFESRFSQKLWHDNQNPQWLDDFNVAKSYVIDVLNQPVETGSIVEVSALTIAASAVKSVPDDVAVAFLFRDDDELIGVTIKLRCL